MVRGLWICGSGKVSLLTQWYDHSGVMRHGVMVHASRPTKGNVRSTRLLGQRSQVGGVVEGAISTKVGKSSAGYKRKKIGVARIAHKVLRPCTYPKTTWLVPPGGAWMRVVERPVMTLPQF